MAVLASTPHTQDDRKSAAVAAAGQVVKPGSQRVGEFRFIRDIMRSPHMRQAGIDAGKASLEESDMMSFFFLDGDEHRERRNAVASYFSPKAITDRYHSVMVQTMQRLIHDLREKGSATLDILSFQLAVDVAAQIVGLTNSDSSAGLAKRMRRALDCSLIENRNAFQRTLNGARVAFHMWRFYKKDLMPAVRARRESEYDDVIGHMVREGRPIRALMIECITYATAGMVTTREFIVMCAWHLFEDAKLRTRFLAGDERDQFAILNEILRLEPVASMLYRRAANDAGEICGKPIREGEVFALDIRAANTDETVAGSCPYALDPDRAKRMKTAPSYMSFGDGHHRCPGAQVALHETRVFLDELLRVPDIRLATPPKITWNNVISSYELRGAIVSCAPHQGASHFRNDRTGASRPGHFSSRK
jgi:cytochrome P450